MPKILKNGEGKTLYIELNIYPCGTANLKKNLTISSPAKCTEFKTTLSDKGLQKFKKYILEFYDKFVTNREIVEK